MVVQGGRRSGAGVWARPGVVDHGPNGGLGTSGAPVVSQRARCGDRWGLAVAAEAARAGLRDVRHGGNTRADHRAAAIRSAARHGMESHRRTHRLRDVVHRVRPAIPARELGGIEVGLWPITIRLLAGVAEKGKATGRREGAARFVCDSARACGSKVCSFGADFSVWVKPCRDIAPHPPFRKERERMGTPALECDAKPEPPSY